VDKSSIDRIRGATFTVVRRGYDRREVDRFLSQVADWLETGAGDPTRAEIIRGELERVGEKTARILASAEESAEQIRSETEREAGLVIEQAREEAERLRADAEEHSRDVRDAADAEARRANLEASQRAEELVAEAERRAQTLTEEGLRRRRDLEAVIGDLLERRDEVLEDVARLADELVGLVSAHAAEEEEAVEEDVEEGELLEEGERVEDEAATPTTPLRVDRE
jgi:DivIVA domain-containing protein